MWRLIAVSPKDTISFNKVKRYHVTAHLVHNPFIVEVCKDTRFREFKTGMPWVKNWR